MSALIIEHTYETVLDNEEGHWTHHRPNPYFTDVTKRAWAEGYVAAQRDMEANEHKAEGDVLDATDSPYTSADTLMAWKNGYAARSYFPAPFSLDGIDRAIVQTSIWEKGNHEGVKELRLLFDVPRYVEGDSRPAWADNEPMDRSIPLHLGSMQTTIRQGMRERSIMSDGSYELPCPPYEFTYEDGLIHMSKGPFTKGGSKEDYLSVIAMMQEAVDNAPQGYDITDIQIGVDVTVQYTATAYISASTLLGQDEWFDDLDALEDRIEEEVRYYGKNYIEIGYLDYSEGEIVDHETTDVAYDIQNGVSEL